LKREDLPANAAWAKIIKLYNKKKYLDAVEKLEIFLINYAGAAMADSAQYYLAECHFYMKEYIIAASEYEKTVLQYPQSPMAMEAEYKLGLSFYKLSPKHSLDQVYTNKAIGAFQLFIEDFPNSDLVRDAQKMIDVCREKLARKDFETGRLYSKMKELASARIYYDMILQNYYDTKYAPQSQFYKAQSYELSKDYPNAVKEYNLYLDKYGKHEWSNNALKNLNRVLQLLKNQSEKDSVETSWTNHNY